MANEELRKYLRLIWKRYLKADKLEGGRLLDEIGPLTGLHRNSLIRIMSASLERKPGHKQHGRTYGPELDGAWQVISEDLSH
jgi:hypothetical protein